MDSHPEQILAHLQMGRTLTQREALRYFGCMRLAARVRELNQCRAGIQKRMITVPGRNRRARVAEYFIPTANP